MTEPSLPELVAERDRLYAQLSVVGDFRRGSVSENWRKCGKPNCACAQPDHPGHGPRFLWTRAQAGRVMSSCGSSGRASPASRACCETSASIRTGRSSLPPKPGSAGRPGISR